MREYKIDGKVVQQILLPNPADTDPHPRLIFNGWGIHAGECFTAWIPGDGFVDIRLESKSGIEGIHRWCIADPKYGDICPVGLWCVVE